MIHFALHCERGHEFEAWFRSNDDFEAQQRGGLVACPSCGCDKVAKALMAPAVATSRKREKMVLAAGAEQRGIYGEASPDEARALAEDGVDFMPIPVLPDEHN